MRPIQCLGKFAMPIKAGKFDILGMEATVSDTALASRFAIVDDESIKPTDNNGVILNSLLYKRDVLADVKGVASVDSTIGFMFPEPIKTRHGISLYHENLVAGSVIVYTR